MTPHLDYSAYSAWMKCPWYWYERYINKVQKRWPAAQRTDALCLGSLVHSGLENYYLHTNPAIPAAVVEENTPTPDTYQLAQRLIHGYVSHFPGEQWPLNFCEQPLRFPLIEGCDGLAKLDRYFYVAEPTRVQSGIPGYEITLRQGWWIHEYKTKSPAVSMAQWIQQWVVKKQADFQMLALQHWLRQRGDTHPVLEGEPETPVNGLLINVIEKPKDYVPQRKCKNCAKQWAFSSWIPSGGDGEYQCPMCGNPQKLKPVKAEDHDETVQCYRTVVERTSEQLEQTKHEISKVAYSMLNMREAGVLSIEAPNREACLDLSKKYGQECDYFRPHNYGLVTIGNGDYERTRDYVGELTNPEEVLS